VSLPPEVAEAFAYADDVANKRIVACKLVQLACERFLVDVQEAVDGTSPWEFNPQLAANPIILTQLLPNIKGPLAGQPIQLMGWQKFSIVNLFGFVERGTTTRRFRQGVIFVPRGNGKTSGIAPVALYLTFGEGEGGAEGYAAAVTRDQARILFDTAREMVRRSPEFRRKYRVDTNQNAIAQVHTASKFSPISSDAKGLDGLNVQIAVCDEIGSHRTSEVYDVLLTATGKRKHPMLISISTATGNSSGIGKRLWDYGVKVLEGVQDDPRMFVLLYGVDAEDDPWDEATWIKANPGWGITVQPDAVRAIMRQARNNPAQEAAAKTRHLNIWVGADEALFSMRAWRESADTALSMDHFEGRSAYVGVDLASKTDLGAVSLVFPDRDDQGRMSYSLFSVCFTNEAAVLEARNLYRPRFLGHRIEAYAALATD
jgi:phage terminase large subunit-like protein